MKIYIAALEKNVVASPNLVGWNAGQVSVTLRLTHVTGRSEGGGRDDSGGLDCESLTRNDHNRSPPSFGASPSKK